VVTDITEAKRAAEAVQKEQQLLRHLLSLQERERKLVAYEIHDGLAQKLVGAQLQFHSVDIAEGRDANEAQQSFDAGMRLLHDSIGEARRLIGGIRPPILDEAGIVPAIEYLISEHQEHGGTEIEFIHNVGADRLALPLETAVFRIVQEALTNACHHSRSDKVRVELIEENGRIRIEVRDWGIGFDPEQVKEGRFGLQGIRERARLLGGQAVIETGLHKGTRMSVQLPFAERAIDHTEPGS
jgi:signal transduction histidine kinase